MIRSLWIGSLILSTSLLFSQSESNLVKGVVTAPSYAGVVEPLAGANVIWLGTNIGTVSNPDGTFQLTETTNSHNLVISYVGFENDTVFAREDQVLSIELQASNVLDDVEVVHHKKTTEISFLDPLKVEKIGEKELLKAACCNLSESFETSPSVDVSFTDAVTGTRQIQMLGLAGPYLQITRENIPYIRGLAANYGLTFIPGTWAEGMQLSKGAGTVINGFESITGQINIELRKPETADKAYLNVYASEGDRLEANANLAVKLDDKWSTALLLHGKRITKESDRNDDGFRDMPTSKHFIALNRWKYIDPSGLRMQFGLKTTNMDNVGGQLGFDADQTRLDQLWGSQWQLHRLEGWVKLGHVFEDIPWRSWAVQIMGVNHDQQSTFGRRIYDAHQQSVYANFLYQSIIGNTNHQVLMGASIQHDDYNENLNDVAYDRIETVPGAFFEYTFGGHDKFSAIAGLRGDFHNEYGLFATPRLHLRYAFNDELVMRASAGRGLRTSNIIAENMGLLASNRSFNIQGDGSNTPYGLQPEIAWNYGLNLVQSFRISSLPGSLTFDLYRTNFLNQIIVDLDDTPQAVSFYNLDGKSYSNSFQAQIDQEIFPRFHTRLAYRWYDVKTTYKTALLEKPLVSKHRLFLNLAYTTVNGWAFDYTINWQGKKRIPNTSSNTTIHQLADYSPSFAVMHAQVSKSWKGKFDIYLGMENISNYRQDNPILASEDPFGPDFDASLIWGPVFGRNTYVGLRYKIQ